MENWGIRGTLVSNKTLRNYGSNRWDLWMFIPSKKVETGLRPIQNQNKWDSTTPLETPQTTKRALHNII
jgi:hypothetical protein